MRSSVQMTSDATVNCRAKVAIRTINNALAVSGQSQPWRV